MVVEHHNGAVVAGPHGVSVARRGAGHRPSRRGHAEGRRLEILRRQSVLFDHAMLRRRHAGHASLAEVDLKHGVVVKVEGRVVGGQPPRGRQGHGGVLERHIHWFRLESSLAHGNAGVEGEGTVRREGAGRGEGVTEVESCTVRSGASRPRGEGIARVVRGRRCGTAQQRSVEVEAAVPGEGRVHQSVHVHIPQLVVVVVASGPGRRDHSMRTRRTEGEVKEWTWLKNDGMMEAFLTRRGSLKIYERPRRRCSTQSPEGVGR